MDTDFLETPVNKLHIGAVVYFNLKLIHINYTQKFNTFLLFSVVKQLKSNHHITLFQFELTSK